MASRFLFIMFFSFTILSAQLNAQTLNKTTAVKEDSRSADRAAIRASVNANFLKDRRLGSTEAENYRLIEFEIIFQGETALALYGVSRAVEGGKTNLDQYRMLDVYGKRGGEWQPIASSIAPRQSAVLSVSPEARKIILEEREKVWRAWFTNDKAALERAIPEEILVISPGGQKISRRAEILESSERFVKNGSKLVRLEFAQDEIQVYGATIILYTKYLYETETGGEKQITAGRATDMFVVRDGSFVNVGWHLDSGK